MMKRTTAYRITVGFFISALMALTACQRQESGNPPTKKTEPAAVIQGPRVTTPQVATPSSIVDNPAAKDLLQRIVRPDLPGMTFSQVKALFPETCLANEEERSISCPGVGGLVSISYAGGPDGILDMVFLGGVASCKTLKAFISPKFGKGEDSGEDNNGVCDVKWWQINPTDSTYYATLGKSKGTEEVDLQIGAEQGP